WKRGILPPLNDPPIGGSHGKPHPTTKILSHAARRRGGRVAARGARAAGGDAGPSADWRAVAALSRVSEPQCHGVAIRAARPWICRRTEYDLGAPLWSALLVIPQVRGVS